jgi:hypothetical protein
LWPEQDEFHEACEYFYVHIGAAEKDHKVESLRGVERYTANDGDLEAVFSGYSRHLQLIADFWDGIFAASTNG